MPLSCAPWGQPWLRRRDLSRLCLLLLVLLLLLLLLSWSVRDVDGVAVECVGAIGEGQRGGAVRCQRVRLCVGLVMGDHWHGV